MSEWREYELEKLVSIGSSKRIFYKEYVDEGIPFYRSKEVIEKNKKDTVSTELFISQDRYNEIKTKFGVPRKGDILLTSVGTLGVPWLIDDSSPFYFKDGNLTWISKFSKDLLNIYFYYWIISPLGKESLDMISIGSTQPAITIRGLRSIDISLPPLPEQIAIAEVLSSLDDKIDLLHRQNKTLEQMAETLFRQWFVEEAQEDWEEKPLSSIANFLNGLACQKFPPKNDVDKLPVLKIKQLRNGFSVDSDWCTTEVKPEYIISDGDVIFSWSASLMVKIWDGEKCILNQHLFKVSSDEFPKWFYYLWSKHHLDEFVSISSSHATTMGHIKRGDLDDAMVLVPSPEEIQEFSEVFTPLIDKIISNNKRLKNLVSLRDALLPKLMSGEVRIASNG